MNQDQTHVGISNSVSQAVATRRQMLRGLTWSAVACLCGCAGSPKEPARPGSNAAAGASRSDSSSSASPAAVAPITNTDACATRMQDLIGAMLLYVVRNQDVPPNLEVLADMPGGEDLPPLVCPVSNRPYVYNPFGIYLHDQRARLILYDASPSHSNMRWAVVAVDATETEPLVCKVIALPESFFVLRPPQ